MRASPTKNKKMHPLGEVEQFPILILLPLFGRDEMVKRLILETIGSR